MKINILLSSIKKIIKVKLFFSFLILLSFFFSVSLKASQWQSVNGNSISSEGEVEVRLRIPIKLLPRFKRLHQSLFEPLDYDWRAEPRSGHYYPYRNFYSIQSYDTRKHPVYFTDQYFNYYKEKVKTIQSDLPEAKKFRPNIRREREIDFVKLGQILFNSNSSSLTSEARQKLGIIGSHMMGKRFSYINIKGYADMMGTKGKNYKLGIKRARRVAEYLESLGVDMRNTYIGSGGETASAKKLKNNRKTEIFGFFSPLPYNKKFSYSAEKLSYDKSSSNYIFIFIIIFLFLSIIGIVTYFVFVN